MTAAQAASCIAKYCKEGVGDMRFSEFGGAATRVAPTPSTIKRQQRVAKVMAQIAASDAQQRPTELDKVLAMRQFARVQKRTDREYLNWLNHQLQSYSNNS